LQHLLNVIIEFIRHNVGPHSATLAEVASSIKFNKVSGDQQQQSTQPSPADAADVTSAQ